MIDWGEFRHGIRETRHYLLSHHLPEAWDRCYAPTVWGTQYRICARCLGIYPGIALGIVAYLTGTPMVLNWLVVGVLPVPALVDWWLSTARSYIIRNAIRTLTGGLLGVGYGLGLGLLVGQGDLRVIGVGVSYGILAAGLLYLYRDRT